MSDRQVNPDWWQASDGMWYPPESHPSRRAPSPPVARGTSEKICPSCAETVKAAAVVCRYCGYDFGAGLRPTVQARTNGLAIASMVLGILWLWWIGSILAVIFGHNAKSQINSSRGTQTGSGMATAGLVLGYIGIATLAVFILALIGSS